jgi:PPOX class probable F420-dependent enzyme
MVPLPSSALTLLNSGALAHVSTINADGSPHVTVVWIEAQGDEVVFFARTDRVKMRNLRRDPRVVISVQDTTRAASGLMQYLTLRGTARIMDGEPIDDLMDRLTTRYMGRDRFPFPRAGQTAVRVAVERLGGNGPWTAGD